MSSTLELEVEDTQMEMPLDFSDVYLANCLKTEAPLVFHRWSILTAIGAALERNCYIKHGDTTIYPNMYTMLVGPSSSRKTSAISAMSRMLKKAGFKKYFSGSTSKEKFMDDLATGYDCINNGELEAFLDGGSADVSNVLVTAGEAIEFFGANNANMVNLMTDLWDNHDSKIVSSKKDGITIVNNPTVSLLAGTTTGQISSMFPAEIIGQGILSRTLLIYCHGSGRKFTFPEPTSAEDEAALVSALATIIAKRGEFTFTEEAAQAIDDIYHAWTPIKDGRFESYTGRRLMHLFKLCMIYTAMSIESNNNVISLAHVVKANTTLAYVECSMSDALGEYGSALNSTLTHSIMNVVKAHKGGITQDEVMGAVHTEYAQQKEVLAAIVKLRDAGKIDIVNKAGANQIMQRFLFPVSSMLNTKLPHVNYDLLAEYTHERKN